MRFEDSIQFKSIKSQLSNYENPTWFVDGVGMLQSIITVMVY